MYSFLQPNQELSRSVYSTFLIKAELEMKNLSTPTRGLVLDMGKSKYSAVARIARDYLLGLGWEIFDGGPE